MKRKSIKRLSIALFLLINTTSFAQIPNNYFFVNLNQEDGLSQGTGYAIAECNGYMWFGTQDGLNRYDGYNFKVYKSTDGKNTINNSFVQSLLTDSKERLWIGTGGGLNVFDYKKDRFFKFSEFFKKKHLLEYASIRSLSEDFDGNLWVLTDEYGLFRLNASTFEIRAYFTKDNTIQDLIIDSHGHVWFSNFKSVFYLNPTTLVFEEVKLQSILSKESAIRRILLDRKGDLWVGTNKDGCYIINIANKSKPALIEHLRIKNKQLASDQVVEFLETHDHKVWIATFTGGITIYDHGKVTHLNELRLKNAQRGLADNSTYSLFEDSKKNVWIGYSNKGIGKYDKQKSQFHIIAYNPDNKEVSLKDNMVFSMAEKNGKLYIATETGGINIFNLTTRKIEDNSAMGKAFKTNEVRSLLTDSEDNIWMINWQTFSVYNTKSHTTTNYTISENYSPYIYASLIPKGKKEIWVTGQGLFRFDFKTKSRKSWNDLPAIKAIEKFTVRSMFQDSHGDIWMGTLGRGLVRFNSKTESTHIFHYKEGLLCDNVRSFLQDYNTLYVGTDCGLFVIDLAKQQVLKHYNEGSNPPYKLPNNVVYGILKDHLRTIWLSTNKGLINFSMSKGVLKTFDKNDGLQGNEFNTRAAYGHNDGTLFFGGVNGVTYFNPENLQKNNHIAPLVITKIKVLDSLYSPLTKKLNLGYKENFIEFEFASLNFTNSQKNQYKYKLEGIDSEWIEAGSKRYANYTNLPPGRYTFKVMGSNNDQLWNPNETTIEIVIKPPFWGYWWFWPIVGILVFSTGVFLYYGYVNEKMKSTIGMLEMRSQIAGDLHDEIGSSLSSIALSANFIKDKVDSDENTKAILEHIEKGAKNSMETIRDTVWALNPENDSFEELISKFRSYALQMCLTKGIHFEMEEGSLQFKNVNLSLRDRKNIFLSLKEILNNAVKHSQATNIKALFELKDKRILIKLKDNGKGFDTEMLQEGNGMSSLKNRAKESGYELSIKSKINDGTVCLLSIPT